MVVVLVVDVVVVLVVVVLVVMVVMALVVVALEVVLEVVSHLPTYICGDSGHDAAGDRCIRVLRDDDHGRNGGRWGGGG